MIDAARQQDRQLAMEPEGDRRAKQRDADADAAEERDRAAVPPILARMRDAPETLRHEAAEGHQRERHRQRDRKFRREAQHVEMPPS